MPATSSRGSRRQVKGAAQDGNRRRTASRPGPLRARRKAGRIVHAGGGRLIVISAPSGAGKTTIAREIMKQNPSVEFSVSATTRPRRPTEVDGKDYFFLTPGEFQRRVDAGKFVEHEDLFGNRYGTLKSEVDRALRHGRHLLFDVDVNGALAIKRQYPESLLIFIRPPSMDVLRERLRNRRTENEAVIARRLERAAMEIGKAREFDVQVVNDDLGRAIAEVQTFVSYYLQRSS
jgi:guanylate kinase